jgi:hypothetical protein
MEETDQELENLLHYLNLPGAVRAPGHRSLPGQRPGSPGVRGTRDEEPGAAGELALGRQARQPCPWCRWPWRAR